MSVNLEAVYQEFDVGLRRYVRGQLSDPAAVDDVLQDIYLRIHRHSDGLREPGKLRSWVYQVARNALIDYYRRGRDTVELPESLAVPEVAEPENEAAAALARSMRQMIGCLPEKSQQALILTEFEGMKQQELARHLGLSLSGAKSRVQRSREQLKATLLDCCHVELNRLGQVLSYTPNCEACARDDYLSTCEPSGITGERQAGGETIGGTDRASRKASQC